VAAASTPGTPRAGAADASRSMMRSDIRMATETAVIQGAVIGGAG
jgi:hypothetical protein